MNSFTDARARIRGWLMDAALPLWAARGVDADGRFHEALDFDGRPLAHLDRRTRVQARQLAVFAEADRLGWAPARAVVADGLERLIETCRREDGLWRETTTPDGAPGMAGPDLYTHAFVLFALAGAQRTLGDDRCRALALETLAQIQAQMADPAHGGWQEALPPVLPRRQNPHMHLLEAMLAWLALPAAEDDAAPFRAMANEVLGLFTTRFFDPEQAALGEYFTADWRPAPGADGDLIEPGHHFEWVWLLRQAQAAGLGDFSGPAAQLYDRAMAEGRAGDGLIVRELNRGGGVRDGGARLWAQTEAIRAMTAMGDRKAAAALIERLFATHLATATPGLWIDSFDADRTPKDVAVPASSLYHLLTAFSEVLRSDG